MQYFETRFLEEADKFIAELDLKTARKVFYNIDLAEQTNDPRLFKKLKQDIWEFRTLYARLQIRTSCILGQNRRKRNFSNGDTRFYQKSGQSTSKRN